MPSTLLKHLVTLFSVILLVACSDQPEPQVGPEAEAPPAVQSLLSYVPADTPYVLANTRRMPRRDIEMLIDKFSGVYQEISKEFGRLIEEETSEAEPGRRVLQLLNEELLADFSLEKMERIGLRPDAYMALYGIDILPLMQIELASEEKFRAFLGRIEARAGRSFPVLQFEGDEYWQIEVEEVSVLVAIVDGRLVAGLSPTALNAQFLPYLFGKKPEQSLQQSGRVAAAADEFGLLGYATGIIDLQRLVALATGERSGFSQQVWSSFDREAPHEISEVCRREVSQLVAKAPRLVFGYAEFSAERMTQKFVLNLEPTLASELEKLVAPVPGIGDDSALINFGFGIRFVEARKFLLSVAQEVARNPYRCQWLAELNEIGSAENQMLYGFPLPPFATDFTGVHLAVHELKLSEEDPMATPAAKMQLFLRADKPQNFLAMLASMAPGMAGLQLQPDSPPQPVRSALIPPAMGTPYIAMSDKGLGVSVGEGMEESLPAFMSAPLSPERPVFFFSYDMALAAQLVEQGMSIAMAGMDPKELEAFKHELAAMSFYQQIFGPVGMSVTFTDKGVESLQSIQFR